MNTHQFQSSQNNILKLKITDENTYPVTVSRKFDIRKKRQKQTTESKQLTTTSF